MSTSPGLREDPGFCFFVLKSAAAEISAAVSARMQAVSRFRPATAEDVDAVVAAMERFYAEEALPFTRQVARHALHQLIVDSYAGVVWIAQLNGEPAGYIVLTFSFSLEFLGYNAFIDELFIEAPYRGLGLGSEALGIATEFCRDRGIRAIHLEVDAHNQRALDLYRRRGFEDHSRRLMTKWL